MGEVGARARTSQTSAGRGGGARRPRGARGPRSAGAWRSAPLGLPPPERPSAAILFLPACWRGPGSCPIGFHASMNLEGAPAANRRLTLVAEARARLTAEAAMAGDEAAASGFSEEAMHGLFELEARLPPAGVAPRGAGGRGAGAAALLGAPAAAARALPRRRARGDARVRAPGARALQRHRAHRREAARQGAARDLRRPQRGDRGRRAPARAGPRGDAAGPPAAEDRRGGGAPDGAGQGDRAVGASRPGTR